MTLHYIKWALSQTVVNIRNPHKAKVAVEMGSGVSARARTKKIHLDINGKHVPVSYLSNML